MSERKGSIGKAFGLMIIVSVLLFWLPTIGPLLAGIAGGKRAGSFANAIIAALIPTTALALLSMIFSSFLIGLPIAGAIIVAATGGTTFLVGLFSSAPLLIGAIIGALI